MRLLIACALLAACGSKSSAPPAGEGSGSAAGSASAGSADEGLDLRLSNGQQGAPAFDRAKLAPAAKLGDATVSALLARAKPLAAEADDRKAFALRPRSQPAPRTGTTVTSTFPPAPSSLLPPKANDATAPLTVLRVTPEGEVPLAPALTVTFSQPMVAVTSQTDATATTPVKLSPAQPGTWRWVGTRTLMFDPEVRFDQATKYTVEIPAGTKSATGNALAAATTATFQTPPPSVVTFAPQGTARTDAPMFLLFDQRIDQKAVLAKLKVTAGGSAVAVRLLDAAELERDKAMAALVAATKAAEQDGRWLVFRAAARLPTDTEITVELPAGVPSAEGPLTTTAATRHTFRTYAPLRITDAECGWNHQCPPGQTFRIELNNPLDVAKAPEDRIKISPAIPDLHVIARGSSITVMGSTAARTTYEVTIDGALADEYGQTLGRTESRSFRVGDALPTFYGPHSFVVADPGAKTPTLDFFSIGYTQLGVKLYQVTPEDLAAFGEFQQNFYNDQKPPRPPGKQVFDGTVATPKTANTLVETSVDLTPALKQGVGHVVAVVTPMPWTEAYRAPTLISWVQVTKLGLQAHVDNTDLVAFVSELESGLPAANVALSILPAGGSAASDAQGLATLPLGTGGAGGELLLAKRGADVAFLPQNTYRYNGAGGAWQRHEERPRLAWHVFDDRRLYKPGEQVSVKGWIRTVDQAKGGDVGLGADMPRTVDYRVMDSRNNEIGRGSAKLTAVGGFAAQFTLPKTPNLGTAYVRLVAGGTRATGADYNHTFQIEEFRRPEFEVTAQASQGPFLVGGAGDVTVKAKYFSGGPLPGAPVTWNVSATRTSFTPANRSDYTFGTWEPYWRRGGYDEGWGGRGEGSQQKSWSHAAVTDGVGAHTLKLDFLSVKPARPMSVTTVATVMDVNRQAWTTSATLLVHPAAAYVGLKAKQAFVAQGKPFVLDVIGVDLDGKALPGAAITLRTVRREWAYVKGEYQQRELDPQTCSVTAAAAAVPCTFQTAIGGAYEVTATIKDAQGRTNETTFSYWVAGGKQRRAREVEREVVEIIPDKAEYRAGNTAELLVQTPFFPAEGIVTWRRSGIVKTERITLDGPSKIITVPIVDAMVPNLTVQVDLVGMTDRLGDDGEPDPALPKRPAYAGGAIDLPVPPLLRTLAVTATPSVAKLGPGEAAAITVEVRDAAGAPVPNAETTVIVVDEAILTLAGYSFTDPVGSFYGARPAGVSDYYTRAMLKLANPQTGVTKPKTASVRRARGGGGDPGAPPPPMDAPAPVALAFEEGGMAMEKKNESLGGMADMAAQAPREANVRGPAIAVRSNFNPLAAFAPVVMTDASGKATVQIAVPDNLTRYRIVAVATEGNRAGKGESTITARLPLMVRPSAPRFLNFGDTFQLPVVVQNQTDAPLTVQLAARTTNLALTDGAGREVTVPPNDRVEVMFPAAAEMAGTARLQIVGTAGKASDAAEVALPVWTPATTEAFATYGTIDAGAIAQPVALPGQVVTQFGGLEVTTASTTLQSLTDAVIYLVRYPYECAEQRSSRILAIAALRDVLAAFEASGLPAVSAIEASVAQDIAWIIKVQNDDGGFAFWEKGKPSSPYLTAFVANALARAKAKGYPVPQATLDRVKPYLKDIERTYEADWSEDSKRTISAFALATRKLLGDLDVAKAQQLIRDAGGVEKLSMEANGWLLSTLAGQASADAERKAIVRHALNRVSETAGAANFTTSYTDGAYLLLASDHRVDGVMLDALIEEQPGLDLIPKVVTGLLAHRKRGHWLNTQENVFALLAMDRYFHTYEKTTPSFVARVWLGDDYAGDHAFRGRTTESHQIDIPMSVVATHDKQSLTIQKDGAGRLYYRIGMTYAPASLKLDAADYGFVVERTYEGVDAATDVVRKPDGSWEMKAGARVRVKLRMVNENRRYHVALVDPLPAGLEPMNPALATTGPVPVSADPTPARGRWWYGPWYEHQNMRDERVEAFASMLWEGVHEYEYVARATTPGHFVVPPPKAEEMYMPETFGRGASDRVVIAP